MFISEPNKELKSQNLEIRQVIFRSIIVGYSGTIMTFLDFSMAYITTVWRDPELKFKTENTILYLSYLEATSKL